ncbi:MAG: hypothetical protein ACJ78Q_04470 [Chloroflexia bacterium]|jgi:hypothetical protein
MDHNSSTNPDSDLVWLTDSSGNAYLMRSDVVARHHVPSEIATQVKDFVESDTQGYGNASYLLSGISKLWGLKNGDKGYDGNFDLDGSGDIGTGDWEIAMKGWYEQNPKSPATF